MRSPISPDSAAQLSQQDIDGLAIAPEALCAVLASVHCGPVHVIGTLDRRLVFMGRDDGRWVVADLSGVPHRPCDWPEWTRGHIVLDDGSSWLSLADVDELYEQYGLQRRTLDDIGQETGMSGTAVAARAREYGIPTRNNRQPKAPRQEFASAPEVLRSALGNSYAIRRLRVFIQVVREPGTSPKPTDIYGGIARKA